MPSRLILIVQDARALRPVLQALPRGGAAVQLRAPFLPASILLERAREMRSICSEFSAPLLVNDRADVAIAAEADGVHLPSRGICPADVRELFSRRGKTALVGVSCHSQADVSRAASGGADYAVFGPIWEVPGKGPAVGIAPLREAAQSVAMPLFALGGVNAMNAGEALAAGARGVAAIRSIFNAVDPVASAVALWQVVSP